VADSQNGSKPPLGSRWGDLSPSLIATFFAVKKLRSSDGKFIRWVRDMAQNEVAAPITDGNMETTLNWQSPFENVGPDQKFSSLSALLQAGGFASVLSSLQSAFPGLSSLNDAQNAAASLEGRTNITKLNSTQVFSGMAPIKIGVTAHFRAYQDADLEVRKPVNQLMSWALPQELAQDGPVAGAVAGHLEVFPSKVPQVIGMKYADMLIAPIVIESIPYPLTGPRTSDGILAQASLQLQLATLTALDKKDWESATERRGFTQFNY
jgi:hypothetical protein